MIGKQLKALMQLDKMEVSELSQIVEIDIRTIYSWTSDNRNPSCETLFEIVQKYREAKGKTINLHWLITGEGEMFITSENKEALNILQQLNQAGIMVDDNGILRKRL